jgi:uncharacterized protein
MSSRLTDARSAYLRSAAHQPVDWYPWTEEAFARAQHEHRPILLDIGAVWCHWCHVMDRESYEDPALATQLNQHWVCIKVDRDERPDVDARYQRAVQAVTGQGGWPLTAFLTPDGEVFYGGTYFPPDARQGRPGFAGVLRELHRAFQEDGDKVKQQAAIIRQHVSAHTLESRPGAIAADLVQRSVEGMGRVFDFQHGGFGSQPKFPHPTACEVLLHHWRDTAAPFPREMVDRTLAAMARGGVYDHVGGGFHRYAMDAGWIVPHFEKMSYDNSELLRVYVHALASLEATGGQADGPTGRAGGPADGDEGGLASLYRRTIEGITDWVLSVMADPLGGYYASQDADVGLADDGDYFTWTLAEVEAVVEGFERTAIVRRFDVEAQGEMPHDAARNVLWIRDTHRDIANALAMSPSEAAALVERGLDRLRAARGRRPPPLVDTTLYVGWNAMMASAMLEAGALLDRPGLDAHALRTLERLMTDGADGAGGVRHAIGSDVAGLLEDHVHLANACVTAYESTGERTWHARAEQLMTHVWEHYRAEEGGLYDRRAADGHGLLPERLRPILDAPTPSPNGVAALVVARLAGHDPENAEWPARQEELLTAFGGGLDDLGLHGAALLLGADWALRPTTHVVVVARDDGQGQALRRAARAGFRPRKLITLLSPGTTPSAAVPEAVRAMLDGASPRAYVCVGPECRLPVTSPDALLEALNTP